MATTTKAAPHRRALAIMALVLLALVGALGAAAQWSNGQWTPKLGLDLEGGTQMVLQPQVQQGSEVNQETLSQAVDIMRARVDGQGVAEAEVSTLGSNVVVSVPGTMTKAQEQALRQSSQMRFRPVIFAAPIQAQPVPTPVPTGATPAPSGSPTGTAKPTGAAKPSGSATPKATASVAPSAVPSGTATPAPSSTAGGILPEALRQEPAAKSPTPTPTATASPAPTSTGGSGLPTAAPTADPNAQPTPSPTGTPTITKGDQGDAKKLIAYASSEGWATDQWMERLQNYNCAKQPLYDPSKENLLTPTISCDTDGQGKYLLGPVVMSGSSLADANSGPATNNQGIQTGGYEVQLKLQGGKPTEDYAAISGFMQPLAEPRNQLAIVLDNQVVSAPRFTSVIPDGNAQITGNFNADAAKALADQLKFGALPMSFTVQSTEQVSPTIGGDQLRLGIIAGSIGLLLVVVYSLIQYRALGLVTVASLAIVAVLTYLCMTFLGWSYNLRLTMAGVTGAIVAIGTTADSFIVYFERVRDEVRDGRRLEAAVQTGWERARRTILVSDGVNFLAAAVLYVLASSNVRGFAFVLMLTTILDILVTFLFTHPLLSLLSRTKFFGEGHKLSGFDRKTLGAKVRYQGRGRVTIADQRAGVAEGSRA